MSELVAPPYDVIGPEEAARLRAQNEAGAIHVELPESRDAAGRYRAAACLLDDWISRSLLARDGEPAMFLYAQRFTIHGETSERWGVLTGLRLESFDDGIVLPHERTLAGPKADRMELIRACRTNLSPIFTLVDASLGLAGLASSAQPIADFTDRAGVRQRLWRLPDPAALEGLVRKVADEPVYIADGHHRYEIALAYRNECRERDGNPKEPQPYDFVLTHLCSTRDPGLVVLPTHRLLADPPPQAALHSAWESSCRVTEITDPDRLWTELSSADARRNGPRVGVLRRGGPGGLLLETGAGAREELGRLAPELAALDVTFLHGVVLPGIPADRFTYSHDERETIAAVQAGATELAVLLPPPRVDDVLAISRARLTMPQKSTYFYPKVLSGLVYNPLT